MAEPFCFLIVYDDSLEMRRSPFGDGGNVIIMD